MEIVPQQRSMNCKVFLHAISPWNNVSLQDIKGPQFTLLLGIVINGSNSKRTVIVIVVHHHQQQQQQQVLASTLSSTSYNLTWLQAVCYFLPTAFFSLVASWSKAEVAGRVGIAIWQALECTSCTFLGQNLRVVLYVKDPEGDLDNISKVTGADEVITLENVSREGGTYLTHILRHYNASISCCGLKY
ncbi:hypothetical protein DFH28DRAFT_929711 [Melampsora americana]|nr:hypothetical protein DFH28DRAFT_929711 [Melampsora americana]